MPNFQRTTIIGHVGGDPERRQVGDSQVANFSVAVTDKWTDKSTGELRESVTWYRCNVWGKAVDTIMKYVLKGNAIMCEGNVSARAYLTDSGEARASLELKVYSFTFLGSGNSTNGQASNNGNQSQDIDDIPF